MKGLARAQRMLAGCAGDSRTEIYSRIVFTAFEPQHQLDPLQIMGLAGLHYVGKTFEMRRAFQPFGPFAIGSEIEFGFLVLNDPFGLEQFGHWADYAALQFLGNRVKPSGWGEDPISIGLASKIVFILCAGIGLAKIDWRQPNQAK